MARAHRRVEARAYNIKPCSKGDFRNYYCEYNALYFWYKKAALDGGRLYLEEDQN
jgi:hypothetical protein